MCFSQAKFLLVIRLFMIWYSTLSNVIEQTWVRDDPSIDRLMLISPSGLGCIMLGHEEVRDMRLENFQKRLIYTVSNMRSFQIDYTAIRSHLHSILVLIVFKQTYVHHDHHKSKLLE